MRDDYWAEDAPPDKNESLPVEVVSNHIYFYDRINNESILKLNKAIMETTGKIASGKITFGIKDVPLYLHINSGGGLIFEGLAVMDTILNNESPIITIVEGRAASAATFLSIVGKERWMRKHSYMLIHQLSATYWGKFHELKDRMKNAEKLMVLIKDLYKEYTKVPMEKIDEILDHDLYFDADKCIEYGLVDRYV
tara:strand:- start:454 stop:1038 length:585 start_codon:yes stop_codon:yes gene_type:complete